MVKLLSTSTLPVLLQTLKEEKYFYDDTPLIRVKDDVNKLISVSNNTVNILNSITEDSKINILPVTNETDTTGYKIDLVTTFGDNNVKIIATGTLNYDTLLETDAREVIEKVNNDL